MMYLDENIIFMPRNKSASIRYRIIDQCLNNKFHPYPSKAYLAEKCSDLLHTEISSSSIEKDIMAMKQSPPHGFDAPIAYSKKNQGYHYTEPDFSINSLQLKEEEWTALRFAAQLLHQYHKVPVFADFRNAMERIHTCFAIANLEENTVPTHVQFESPVETHGMEWLVPLYTAIVKREGIRFTYRNIYRQQTKTHELIPQLLREHRNRWYVVGWHQERKDHLTFALDRILTVETFHHQIQTPFLHPDKFYHFSSGIMRNKSKAKKIILQVRNPFSELLLLEPLHPSQTLVSHNEGQIRISLELQLNEELYLRILGLGPWCKVIQPQSLQKTIENMASEMAVQYRK